jgi:hypothetical protein
MNRNPDLNSNEVSNPMMTQGKSLHVIGKEKGKKHKKTGVLKTSPKKVFLSSHSHNIRNLYF